MNIAPNAFLQRELCDFFDAFDVGGGKGFVGRGEIADCPQVKNPVHISFKKPGQCFGFGQVGGDVFDAQAVKKGRVFPGAGGCPDPDSLPGKKFNKVTFARQNAWRCSSRGSDQPHRQVFPTGRCISWR